MKILFIQKEGGIFGAEQFHLKTIPALQKEGIDLHFLRLYTDYQLGKDSEFVFKLKEIGVPVDQVNIGRFPGVTDILKIKNIIAKGQFDIVHTHLIHADLYGAIIKQFFIKNMMLVSTKHGYDENYNNEFGFNPKFRKKNLYYRICKYSEGIVNRSYAISDGLRGFFIDSGISKKSVMERIHYGFDMKSFKPNLDPTGFRMAPKQLVIVGRLVGFKGHRYALEAVLILREKHPDIKLIIVGIGELELELKQKVIELGIGENVEFLEFKSNVADYMYHSDVVLIPSTAEGFGVVFLEAVNQEKPVAAFDVSAGNEILKGAYDGYLTEPFDVNAYASLIDNILSNPKMMVVPSEKAKERLLNYFTIDRMICEMIDFYKKVLLEKGI